MERYAGKVAIVTGAGSGIGEAIAGSLTKAGMKVVGLDLQVEGVQSLAKKLTEGGAKGNLHPVQCNMRVEEDVIKAFEWTTKNIGNVQVLVNNAGIIRQSNLAEGDTEDWRAVMETNMLGYCIAAREAVKVMKANSIEGHIIYINSSCGQFQQYFPTIGVYGASKHAVKNVVEIMRREMVEAKTNIKVSNLSPGLVRTNILGTMAPAEQEKFVDINALKPQDIADGALYILGVPHRVQINELYITPLNFNIHI